MSNSYNDYFNKAQQTKGLKKKPSAMPSTIKAKSSSKRRSINFKLVFFALFGLAITSTGTLYIDEVVRFFSRLDISVIAKAVAEEGASATAKPEDAKANSPVAKTNEKEKAPQSDEVGALPSPFDDAELNHLARLKERKSELDKREENLNKMEAELVQQKQEVEQKLKELEEVRRKISSVLEERVQNDDQKIDNLVQFYSNMKAPQAAKIIETIDEDLAVQVIAKMKKKNAADIMNLLKPEKAQSISEKYVGYRK